MAAPPAEDLAYKQADHQVRGVDEYAAAKYDLTTGWLGLDRRRDLAGRRLANVGCGGGEYSLRAAALGLSVVACEPEAAAFALARQACAGVPAIRVVQAGLAELAAAEPPVDFLVMHDVLEHIEDEAAAVRAMGRLLAPGGEAVLSVPALQWLFGHHDVQLGHHRRYDRARLAGLFGAGWEVLRTRYYGPAFVPVTLLYSRWLRRPYPVQQAASAPWKRRLVRAACQLQRVLPSPLGTSVLIHLRRRPAPRPEGRPGTDP